MADKASKTSKSSKAAPKKPNIFQRFFTYLRSVRQEIRRTSWPSGSEVLRMSGIVIGALLFFGVIIYSLDSIMTQLVAWYARLAARFSPDTITQLLEQINESLH
jgi:preprotein translocase subunit SecE